jgi:hypothetical protein
MKCGNNRKRVGAMWVGKISSSYVILRRWMELPSLSKDKFCVQNFLLIYGSIRNIDILIVGKIGAF